MSCIGKNYVTGLEYDIEHIIIYSSMLTIINLHFIL